MRTAATVVVSLAALLPAGFTLASPADLAQRIAAQDGWVAWQVPMVEGVGTPCCYEFHAHHATINGTCDLESRNWSFGTNDDDPRPVTSGDLSVYAHVAHGQIDKLRAYAASCTLRNADKVRWLDAVAPADSVAALAGEAARAPEESADGAVASIALHADGSATPALEHLADASHARHLREQALFWLALARGADGARFVEHVATTDADAELRANAVFDLSQAHGIDAYASIHAIAQRDTSEHVREQALFWMAQTGDARARDDIVAAINRDRSDRVREQAVFALSQLKDGAGETALIAIVRGDYPRKVKEQALFWLGQSGSDAAMNFLDEVLTRAARPGSTL